MITTTANGYNSINNNGDDGDSNDNNNADDNNNNNSNDNDNHKDNNVNKSNNNNDAYNKAELLGTACNPGSVEGMGPSESLEDTNNNTCITTATINTLPLSTRRPCLRSCLAHFLQLL